MTNPYLKLQVFLEGVTENNIDRFLNHATIAFEETDHLPTKIMMLKACQRLGIPRIMLTDIVDGVGAETRDFRQVGTTLAHGMSDEELSILINRVEAGENAMWNQGGLAETLFGQYLITEPFAKRARGEGEHATNSIPQSGDTSLGAAYAAAKLIKMMVLGQPIDPRYFLQLVSQVSR